MALTATERQRRSRAHRSGNHSLCDPLRCQDAATQEKTQVTADVTPVTGGLAEIVRLGDRRRALRAVRDRIAGMLEDDVDPRDAAALSRELRALMAELASLDTTPKVRTGLDELEQRRAVRQQPTG